MFGVLMLTQSVKSWKLLITKFILESNDRFWGALFFSKVIIQVILGKSGEIGALGTIQGSSWFQLGISSCAVHFFFLWFEYHNFHKEFFLFGLTKAFRN